MFSPRIFRDMQEVDYMKHFLSVIFRVVRYGTREDFRHLRKVYTLGQIQQFLERRGKELDEGEKELLSCLIKTYA